MTIKVRISRLPTPQRGVLIGRCQACGRSVWGDPKDFPKGQPVICIHCDFGLDNQHTKHFKLHESHVSE